MSRVIAAIDSSLAAKPVLAMALAAAPHFAATVDAVYVTDGPDQTVQSEADDAGVALRWLKGDPLEQIAAAVAADDVVGLVIGAHRHALGGHAGHLPLALASTTDKPVIVVPPSATPPDRLRRVLVAIEGTTRKAKALQRALTLLDVTGLEIVVVHVNDEASIPRFSDQVQHETEAYTREFFARFLPGLSHARLELRIGVTADEILVAAREAEAELLAIGWPQTEQRDRGQVARELLDRSPVPVLLVATA